ncbi:hypothetical protein E2C01_090690 [Portunus trituberculatus]|uniref:Uncharacterized protein n=1 Tax=Portunus trituberculatus TaxID=210409 RepID=A0A5B7JMF3_PORTR|nr:hypothetical protein [Portunus trituberculatus]
MADQPSLDLRLILEYDGSGALSVVEWIEKLELICKLRNVSDVASVIPLRLSGGAFAVYLQLAEADRKKVEKIKEALLAAFVMDPYIAYEQFISRSYKLVRVRMPFWLSYGAWHHCSEECLRRGSPVLSSLVFLKVSGDY